jgi:hypothetical protein
LGRITPCPGGDERTYDEARREVSPNVTLGTVDATPVRAGLVLGGNDEFSCVKFRPLSFGERGETGFSVCRDDEISGWPEYPCHFCDPLSL